MAKKRVKTVGKKKSTLAKVAIGAAITVGVLAFAGLAIQVNDMDKTDKLNATFGYEQGLLSATDGGEVKGTTSIRTKDFISLDGFKVDIKDDASVVYQLFFYNEDEEFISATEELSVDYDYAQASVVTDAEKVRIMVTPVNDPEVGLTEIVSYASELTVEWTKSK